MIKLFCIPHAGGSASIYSKWRAFLNPAIELHPVELCGRGSRHKEDFYQSIDDAAEDIYSQIDYLLDGRFALFGHSMGSLLAYEVCRKIKERKGMDPVHLFASGRQAPQCKRSGDLIHTKPDHAVISEIVRLQGTTSELVGNQIFLEYFLPIIKADYKIIEQYNLSSRDILLNCDMTVMCGTDDDFVYEELSAWQQHTAGTCRIQYFNGGHFYLNDEMHSVVRFINSQLINVLTEKQQR
ncbi:thioesterase II family protein [Paenibacillus macquariensis]|uniref:Surfactin synthase thioesterase subunit n=1 Tax=Paenibacillus macquariensis TaxID=948756 RepID=A0ABY1K2J3_9BACL|nr:thioesterase domain-containing protein [Paenibacillus macquariensis]MEC0090190.1 thioesterase domain-containing protein [Paenibacillus macquariensis]OAB39564.1 hypothetical protein PMSM_00055 [Paenibacillus macquariensis subsp. macquariensis]SIR17048.1 Surfactin synthase thioesterase subunit [Paenibacillus macquariensis]